MLPIRKYILENSSFLEYDPNNPEDFDELIREMEKDAKRTGHGPDLVSEPSKAKAALSFGGTSMQDVDWDAAFQQDPTIWKNIYQAHVPDFIALGDIETAKKLSAAKSVINSVSALVSVGDTVSSISRSVASWVVRINNWLKHKKLENIFNEIRIRIKALVDAIIAGNDLKSEQMVSSLKNDSRLGFLAIRQFTTAELCLAFIENGIQDKVIEYADKVLSDYEERKVIERILERRNDVYALKNISRNAEEQFKRNMKGYAKNVSNFDNFTGFEP